MYCYILAVGGEKTKPNSKLGCQICIQSHNLAVWGRKQKSKPSSKLVDQNCQNLFETS